MSAKRATKRQDEPVQGSLDPISRSYTSKIDRTAMWTASPEQFHGVSFAVCFDLDLNNTVLLGRLASSPTRPSRAICRPWGWPFPFGRRRLPGERTFFRAGAHSFFREGHGLNLATFIKKRSAQKW